MKWIADNWKVIATAALILFVVALAKLASYYHGKYITAESLAAERKQTIDDMTMRQRAVTALDEKYTKELASAQATIDQLQRDVASGKRRLQLNATCTKQSATSTGVDDAASPGLTDSAERDYFTLRNRIELAGKQIAGLQQYIKEQCLR